MCVYVAGAWFLPDATVGSGGIVSRPKKQTETPTRFSFVAIIILLEPETGDSSVYIFMRTVSSPYLTAEIRRRCLGWVCEEDARMWAAKKLALFQKFRLSAPKRRDSYAWMQNFFHPFRLSSSLPPFVLHTRSDAGFGQNYWIEKNQHV